ncbi:MAG: glycine cleavage system protein H, partial [Thermodesulfobacteriota bacterium]
MDIPEYLKYTKEHEWVIIEDDIAMVGITDFAQDSLGEIVYLELPEAGTEVEKDGPFGVVESVKSVSD